MSTDSPRYVEPYELKAKLLAWTELNVNEVDLLIQMKRSQTPSELYKYALQACKVVRHLTKLVCQRRRHEALLLSACPRAQETVVRFATQVDCSCSLSLFLSLSKIAAARSSYLA